MFVAQKIGVLWSPFAIGTTDLDALEVAKDGILGWEDALEIWGSFRPPSVSLCTLLLI